MIVRPKGPTKMIRILKMFKKEEKVPPKNLRKIKPINTRKPEEVAMIKGDIGEHKIDIQLSQLPKNYKYLNDIMITNPKSISGYSQIDHLVITPYGIFVIETKNYQGTIYGGKNRKTWLVNGKFKMLNPLFQNYGHIEALKYYVEKKHHDHFISLISFTKRCKLKIGEDIRDISSDEMVVYDFYLFETINRKVSIAKIKSKEVLFTDEEIVKINEALSEANITDPVKREEHNKNIRAKTGVKERTLTESAEEKCFTCNKEVSQKVKKYCLTNKKFNGKIYCYEHQKTV